MTTRQERAQQRAEEAQAMSQALTTAGYKSLYGGSKGHGFWIDGIARSGFKTRSGNPHFLTMADCRRLLKVPA